MTAHDILGEVAAAYLLQNLLQEDEGTARYLLDCLTAEQTAAVAKAILAHRELKERAELKLPRHFLESFGLPGSILTDERTTYFRNAACAKPALVVANTGDDEEQSLKELVPIGAPQLLSHPELWVQCASAGTAISDDHKLWWKQALKGLVEARSISLAQFSRFVAETRAANIDEGLSIKGALGHSLTALRIPRDTAFFEALNDKTSRHASRWRNLFATAFNKRSCYLLKQTPTQVLLEPEKLRDAFDRVKETSIPPEIHAIVDSFIDAPSGWNEQSEKLAECEWERVRPLFDGLKREPFNLGAKTLEFYDDSDPDSLSEDDRDYLERLIARKTTEASEEDEAFYLDRRLELKESITLKARWDKFIFGAPVETEDFLCGLTLCLQSLFDQDLIVRSKKLRIESDKRLRKDLKQLNHEAGLFFAFRYRGLPELLGRSVSCEFGELFDFPKLDESWRRGKKPFRNRSTAKAALQIKFYLELEIELSQGTQQTFQKQLIWKYNPNAISSELHNDWSRLQKNPFLKCQANRESISGKGKLQSIDLENVMTLLPTYDRDRGSLVSVYNKSRDIELEWIANLDKAVETGSVSIEVSRQLLAQFSSFREAYDDAITSFSSSGLEAAPALFKQLESYCDLLKAICVEAKGDRNRELLLKPLMQIGTVPVAGGSCTSIVAPWHPLRMAAIASKAVGVSSLIKHLVDEPSIFIGDTRLFFEELEKQLDHPYYPEIVISWDQTKPELLALTDHYLDYSLHEPPLAQPEVYADTNENPKAGADRVIEILKRYLALHPHERANLSVVLYNCDSARLPQAIVEKVQELHEDDGDLRCQVVLRHREGGKLRQLYESIIETSESDIDSFVASEASTDFMARLRIGIMADEAPPPADGDGPPVDVVFLQDVVARHAQIEWYAEPAQPLAIEDWIPPRWSRRKPAATDDLKSVVYLCCPAASEAGWNYLTALSTFLRGDWDGEENLRLLPARQLNFNDTTTRSIFDEVHNLGNWVVNYDELLDRRQLLNQKVKVIRYKQTGTQGRNMLISSNCSTSLLQRMVLSRLRALNLGLTAEEYAQLAKRFVDDANLISGDLVLRAAKRGRNASELIGVVLSAYLIKCEVGANKLFGWYFLDDYAAWLGQREEQIADILVLSPEECQESGRKRLAVVVSEAKYVDYPSLSAKRKESQKQLRQTVDRIAKALFGSPGRLDRDIWLSRFSDMLLQGIHFSANDQLQLSQWRRDIRDGECEIYLRGYSHVFISGPTDCPECSDFTSVSGCDASFQEVFSRGKLRELVLHYWRSSDPIDVRAGNAGDDHWANAVYTRPAERIRLTTVTSKSKTAQDSQSVDEVSKRNSREVTDEPRESDQQFRAAAQPAPRTSGGFLDLFWSDSSSPADSEEDLDWLKLIENRAKGALQQFQLRSKLLASNLTPNAAILKFEGSADLTVDKVLRRRSEFLTTHGLDLISVRAEPGKVSISIARPQRRTLMLKEAWASWKPDCTNGNIELLIGIREEDGAPLMYSPQRHAPHALIAGSTGSGKSVLTQNIILSIAATNTPEQAKLIIIDPKQVDYLAFSDLPHLDGGIIDEQDRAVERLEGLVEEMNRRYSLLKENRVTNIYDLLRKPDATERPPFLWVIHDEFAEWMLVDLYKEAVSTIVSRLGVKARAAGIFLIFAAQRPDSSVMPMQLRSNLGNRLILRVDSEGTSEIALGEKGAERLLGKGHMCTKLEGEPDLIYAQVPFVPDAELYEIVGRIGRTHKTDSIDTT